MVWTLIGIIFFLIVFLIAFRISFTKRHDDDENLPPMIHASGIYSIVRKSPRETICGFKPGDEEIRKYLTGLTVDSEGHPLSDSLRNKIFDTWQSILEENIVEIENGDKEGIEFYFFDIDAHDGVCNRYLKKGFFVSREEIHNFPQIIPPLHLGCNTRLHAHRSSENLRETTEVGIRPFFNDDSLPPLPEWKELVHSFNF